MSETVPLYALSNVQHGYGREFNLVIPEFYIEQKTSLGLVGPNGCGKSTLLRILSFLETPNTGELSFEGIKTGTDLADLRNQVTLVLQEPYLLKRSVFENVAYGLRIRGKKHNLKDRVHEALDLVGLPPKTFAGRHWYELSGGEAQRVSVASRLILRPKVLLLDEPTASVDTHSANLIQKAIIDIRNRFDTTIIIASHDRAWLSSITDSIIRIHKGRIVGAGIENILPGPWDPDTDNLWSKQIGDGNKIYALKPPEQHSIAVLHPWDIMIATEQPAAISAQNVLQGEIKQLTTARENGRIQIEVQTPGIAFTCTVTDNAAEKLSLLPGKKVFVVFKASSVSWQ